MLKCRDEHIFQQTLEKEYVARSVVNCYMLRYRYRRPDLTSFDVQSSKRDLMLCQVCM
jgi:hypothetical protein